MKGKFGCTGVSLAIFLAAFLANLGCGYSNNNNSVTGNGLPQTPSRVYVVNSNASTVSAFNIDPSNGALTPAGNPVATGSVPNYAAATPDGKFLYVANTDVTKSSVSAYTIDRTTGALTPTNPPSFPSSDDLPFGIVVNPTSTRVYTANELSISAYSIDPTTGNLHELAGSPVAAEFGDHPQDLRISPNGQFLFVTNGINGVVSTYTFDQNGLPQQVSTLRAGGFPVGIAVDPAGKSLYVADLDLDRVSSFSITPGTGALVPLNSSSTQHGCAPQETAVDPESKFLYVSCTALGVNTIDVFVLDPTTGAIISEEQQFSTGDNTIPHGLAFDPSGKFLFSALSSSNQISTQAVGANGTLTSAGVPANTAKTPVGVVVVPGR